MKSTFRLRPLQGAIILALASASPFSYALRLGEPSVKSYVGQPLVAEFAIEETTSEELRRLHISLANPDLYASMRTTFHPSLKTSSLAIIGKDTKTPKLILRTDGPVEDSVVDIVFELTWAAGRMIQASTALIDPPPNGVVVDAPEFVATPLPRVSKDSEWPVVRSISDSRVSSNDIVASRTSTTEFQSVHVRKGDTLSKIASRMNLSGVKLEQTLIALYNKNSKVISSKNINLIREGTILVLPTKQEVLAVDASQALKTVSLHASNFRSYSQNLAQASGSSTKDEIAPRSQSGKISSEIIESRNESSSKDQVRIGAGAQGATNGGNLDKASAIQARNAESEAKSRQMALDQNLKDLADLAKIKNEQLAKMQKNATAELIPPPDLNTKPIEVAPISEPDPASKLPPAMGFDNPGVIIKSEDIRTSPIKIEEPKKEGVGAGNPSPPGTPIVETPMLPDTLRPSNAFATGTDKIESTVSQPQLAVSPKSSEPKATKPKAAPKVKTEPVLAPPVVESDSNDILPIALGGAGILALLGGWLYTRRKKKIEDELESEEESAFVVNSTSTNKNKEDAQTEARRVLDEIQENESDGDEEFEDESIILEENEEVQSSVSSFSAAIAQSEIQPKVVLTEFPAMPVFPVVEEPIAVEEEPDMSFDLSFSDDSELELLTKSLSDNLPSLDVPTTSSDMASYPVSLTYDPDEQLGIAKFYLGLQDYRGVWDMVHPLLNHERTDVKAQANSLLDSIPEEFREEWLREKQ